MKKAFNYKNKYKYKFIIISTDFSKAVCKGFSTVKNIPFYGISLGKFDYKLEDNFLTFDDQRRADNAINHFYFKELAAKENCEFRSYCISK